MLLSGGTPRPQARSAHEGISPAGAVYRRSSRRPRLQEARRLRRSFFSAVLGSLQWRIYLCLLGISNLTCRDLGVGMMLWALGVQRLSGSSVR